VGDLKILLLTRRLLVTLSDRLSISRRVFTTATTFLSVRRHCTFAVVCTASLTVYAALVALLLAAWTHMARSITASLCKVILHPYLRLSSTTLEPHQLSSSRFRKTVSAPCNKAQKPHYIHTLHLPSMSVDMTQLEEDVDEMTLSDSSAAPDTPPPTPWTTSEAKVSQSSANSCE
jgi:hypothetical protein